MKNVAILCGGTSYEHEVSIITGIQVFENVDTSAYKPFFIYVDKNNTFFWLKNFSGRKNFKTAKRVSVSFTTQESKGYITLNSFVTKKHSVDVAYLAFHGGSGEAGNVQGLLELCNIPFTSPGQEASVVSMNKRLTKEALDRVDIPTLKGVTVSKSDFIANRPLTQKSITDEVDFPIITKPVHLGSSIGIEVCKSAVELEKALITAFELDNEVLCEPALSNFTEYNIAVRSNKGEINLSPIEEPVKDEEILSFDDKYASGAKKTAGMESLDRKLPAPISDDLADTIKKYAKEAFVACDLAGLVRIDFLYHDKKLYCSEINPIPGSMAFYIWEADGEEFQEQITVSVEDALYRHQEKTTIHPYETDIADKFIAN